MIVFDAKNSVLGRLASHVAKQLLKGNDIIIVNAEKAIITGTPKKIVGRYLKMRRMGSPQHGPFFPKKPDLIMRRAIRGMLPKTKKGVYALKKLRIYLNAPSGIEIDEIKIFAQKEINTDYITLAELSSSLGWKK